MGKYVCEAQNGARDENSSLIVVREEASLYVQCKCKTISDVLEDVC